MTFITQSNFKRILFSIKIEELTGEIYKEKIFFLSKKEQEWFLTLQKLLKDGKNGNIGVYKKIERDIDSHTLVFEGGQSAYHENPRCERLHSDYVNFEIPDSIKEKGFSEVEKFRIWFKKNMYLLDGDKEDLFKLNLLNTFGVELKGKIHRKNLGFMEVPNKDLTTLENEIDNLLRESKRYYVNADSKKQELIKRFQTFTYRENTTDDTYAQYIDGKNISLKELKAFLKEFDSKFKKPVKDLLIEYFRVKLNPKLEFKGKLLDELGFKPCPYCTVNENDSEITTFGELKKDGYSIDAGFLVKDGKQLWIMADEEEIENVKNDTKFRIVERTSKKGNPFFAVVILN